jgi:hypothetical protein
VEAPHAGASNPAAADPLCACGHLASNHAEPSSGDTRCLAVEHRRDLLAVFDDGRDTAYGYCACLRFQPATTITSLGR